MAVSKSYSFILMGLKRSYLMGLVVVRWRLFVMTMRPALLIWYCF